LTVRHTPVFVSRQARHRPQATLNGTETRSPNEIISTSEPFFYYLARDLVPEHHACGGSCAAADHVLIGSADIGRNDLQDHAMLDLAASRVLKLGIGDVLDLDFSWLDVDDATIFAHGNLFLWSEEFKSFQRGAKASGRTGT
jgi:hypothetical protein